jgi:hypothetical protein
VHTSTRVRRDAAKEFVVAEAKMRGIVFLISGVIAILAGIFGRTFYKAGPMGVSVFTERRSTWSGRLIFIVVGMMFVALGAKFIMAH